MPPRKGPAGPDDDAPFDFEQSMKRLETIVEELESGELALEESIARYEEGVKLSRALTRTLDAAEKRIERLVEGEAGAPPATRAMEPDADAPEGELPF